MHILDLVGGLEQSLAQIRTSTSGGCAGKSLGVFGFTLFPAMVDVRQLFTPDWESQTAGARISVVVKEVFWGDGVCLGLTFPGEHRIRIHGSFPAEALGFPTVTVVGAVLSSSVPVVDLTLDESSYMFGHVAPSALHAMNLVEVCSGAGFSSVGFSHVGFRHCCAVEIQDLLAGLHESIHAGVPVIRADVTKDSTAVAIHKICPDVGTIMSGIACQPYSRGGSQRGADDSRSATLPGTLRLAWLLQAPFLVIECVTPARNNQWVESLIKALHDQLGYHVVEASLKLEHVWCALRFRWWVVASALGVGPVKLQSYPSGSTLVVRDLMPFVYRWPQSVEDQLTLHAQELEKFQMSGDPLRKYVVQGDAKLPTALHSWGGQVQGCACGCREAGFSDCTLQLKGIYAQLLQIPPTNDEPVKYRHLHAVEVAMLNGVPPKQNWGSDERLNLCAVGQLASPLHSVWIAASIVRHVQLTVSREDPIDPCLALSQLKQIVHSQSKLFFADLPKQMPTKELTKEQEGPKVATQFFDSNDVPWTVVHQSNATASELLHAECSLQSAPSGDVVMLDADGLVVQPESLLCRVSKPRVVCRQSSLEPESCPVMSFMMPFATEPVCEEHDLCGVPVTLKDVLTDEEMSPAPMSAQVNVPTCNVPSDASVDSLMALKVDQLLGLSPPLVGDLALCTSMRHMVITPQVRLKLLGMQLHTWSDDELLFHLTRAVESTGSPVVLLDPILATGWNQAGNVSLVQSWMSLFPNVQRIVSAVLLNGHWTSFLWILHGKELDVLTWECDDVDINVFNPLHGLMCQAMQAERYNTYCTRRNFGFRSCGPAVIAFALSQLSHQKLPANDTELHSLAEEWRAQFRQMIVSSCAVPRPWCWGDGAPELNTVLSTLLQFHGVPQAVSRQRARLVLQSLGADQVKQAIEGVTPWKSLKQLANQHTPVVQLVMPDELAQVVAQKKNKNGKPAKGMQQSVSRPAKPVDIDPSRLVLEANTFGDGSNNPVQQIGFSQVGPLATGVALASYTEAQQFLQSGQILTSKSLALLVVNGPDELSTALSWSTIRFAAKCALNQQPLLLNGFLVQLGRETVQPLQQSDVADVSEVPVTCARLTVYKDQLQQDWDEFSEHPVRNVLNMLPPLTVCKVPDCKCAKWHPEPMESQEVVLDVFRRQFFSDSGRPVKANQASHFSVQVRYIKTQEVQVLKHSGCSGLYIEPRLPDASAATSEYQVVWMPQSDFSEVQHKMQCEPLCIGMARSGRRYGLRVCASKYQQLFQQMKPDSQFLSPGERLHWLCGPWPFGSDRKMLARVFADKAWQARPLQPAKTVDGGIMWLVQSVVEPVQSVWQLKHGPVVVSRCESMSSSVAQSHQVIGPQSTVDLVSSAAPPGIDPWTLKDPWQQALKSVPVPAAPCMNTQLQEIEERLEKSLLNKLPAEKMETDEQDARIARLEQQMQHLATMHQSLETSVTEHHNQHTAQVHALQSQMLSQMEVQKTQVEGLFQDQMARLEAILSKKQRHE